MNVRRLLWCTLLLFFALGCGTKGNPETAEDALSRLPDDEAGDVVRQSIGFAAGDWESWTSKRDVSYRKTTIQLDEDGSERRRIVQMHHYVLHPTPKMRLSWEEGDHRYLIINDGEQAWKWIDGERAASDEDRNHAWNSSFGSHYVFAMPFKLTDPGARLSYEGVRTLPEIGDAHAVRVDYEEGAGSAGGMHTWTYFFAADDFRLVANHLNYGPNPDDYDYTEYTDYAVVDGIHMPTRRYGYRSNASGERLRQTSEIYYEDIQFDTGVSDALFDLETGTSAVEVSGAGGEDAPRAIVMSR